jgi:hypothetical protein
LAEAPADPSARRRLAFVYAFGRPPTDAERSAAEQFLADQTAVYGGKDKPAAEESAWTDFCQMLLASNAFLYVD